MLNTHLSNAAGIHGHGTLLGISISAGPVNYRQRRWYVAAALTLHASPHSFPSHYTGACLVTAQLPSFGQLNWCATTMDLSEQLNSRGAGGKMSGWRPSPAGVAQQPATVSNDTPEGSLMHVVTFCKFKNALVNMPFVFPWYGCYQIS